MLKWVNKYFNSKKIDDVAIEELEESLILGDVGLKASQQIIDSFSKNKLKNNSPREALAEEIKNILDKNQSKLEISQQPHIIMMAGVNGSGKTTVIGKMAHLFKKQGKKVSLIAADTFRAAAVEQLQIWGDKNKIRVFSGRSNCDPAALCYDGLREAIAQKDDVVLIDTAGRLQNKTNLMDELKKIVSVIKKIDISAPHNTILTIDATTGQNALSQIKTFSEFVDVSGLIVNKFDGTAKAGVVVAICQEFDVPIYYLGMGEKIDDLKEFDSKYFVEKLLNI